jgi:hypothetical protein
LPFNILWRTVDDYHPLAVGCEHISSIGEHLVAPIVVGGGKRSLPDDVCVKFELLGERRFGNGMVYLHYRTRT